MRKLLDMKDSAGRIADKMTLILGLLGLLQDGAFGQINDRQKGALAELLATSEELRELLASSVNGRGLLEPRAK
jgi:hypothetical protein